MCVLRLLAALAAGLAAAAAPQATEEPPFRRPAMPEWALLRKVAPVYPSVALARRITGVVRFSATIAKDGHIERLRLVSGHPLLVRAAREAAEQWVYRPTLVGGKPVRVITVIEVPFQLDPYGRPLRNDDRDSKTPGNA